MHGSNFPIDEDASSAVDQKLKIALKVLFLEIE